ncbi:hypothetical protein C8Q75DRAFT_3801 [Abortiporus biennis]|nr:hypothetical protein C8Q75DRAFT_3801 [Abortiporus biennis]
MYDFPSSHSVSSLPSMPPPSPAKRHHHQHHHHNSNRRSHSPVPRISTLLPHTTNQYSPNSRAADINRLLDPAYSSGSSSSSAGSSSRAYVDHRGDLHDPDYRDFPLLPPTARSKSTRKQRRTSGSSARSHSATRGDARYSNYSVNYATRPSWERDWTVNFVDDEDEDELEDEDGTVESHSYSHHTPSTRTVHNHSSHHHQYSTHYSPYYGEPVVLSSSPVSLGDDNALQLLGTMTLDESAFEAEIEEVDLEERPRSRRSCLIRKTTNAKKEEGIMAEKQHEDEAQNRILLIEEGDFVYVSASPLPHASPSKLTSPRRPTCTHSLRRQWQAVSLRFRFGVFHAKQRLRRTLK